MTQVTPAARTPWSIPLEARTEWLRLADILSVSGPAPCEEGDPEAWWPTGKDDPDPMAVRGCQECPARAVCLSYAVAAGERGGIWGGLTEAERAALSWPAAA